ncbi:MAG: dTMP kinase [Bryobacterales bacterium]|nr:dTMP kinase [Bryobacteraceae bacterium]MDW8130435.1 dTMP kinase [Bryobacterales bacterium]
MSTTERGAGRFISFEGVDGAGKTTQTALLADWLRDRGFDVVVAVEPGGTPVGEQIRAILLDKRNSELAPEAELLLYFASRAQNVARVIRPALARGAIVLSDRYTDSTIAYQAYGRGLGEPVVRELHRLACGDLWPDLTLLLDLDPDIGLQRALQRGVLNRMDEQARDFRRRVREAYRQLADREPERFRVIDAAGEIAQVAAEVQTAVLAFLGL